MIRILRAFAWMRWRVLVNSLEVTGARDAIERLSVAVEQIGPIIAILVLVPSSLALGALSAFAGYTFGQSGESVAFEVLRYLLLTSLGLCVVGPILMPVAERTTPVALRSLAKIWTRGAGGTRAG